MKKDITNAEHLKKEIVYIEDTVKLITAAVVLTMLIFLLDAIMATTAGGMFFDILLTIACPVVGIMIERPLNKKKESYQREYDKLMKDD